MKRKQRTHAKKRTRKRIGLTLFAHFAALILAMLYYDATRSFAVSLLLFGSSVCVWFALARLSEENGSGDGAK